jgi:hypothetical protein
MTRGQTHETICFSKETHISGLGHFRASFVVALINEITGPCNARCFVMLSKTNGHPPYLWKRIHRRKLFDALSFHGLANRIIFSQHFRQLFAVVPLKGWNLGSGKAHTRARRLAAAVELPNCHCDRNMQGTRLATQAYRSEGWMKMRFCIICSYSARERKLHTLKFNQCVIRVYGGWHQGNVV